MDALRRCPCGSGDSYGGCCGRYHDGTATAPTAERLMRSRYSAFVVGDEEYLQLSWHPDTRPVGPVIDPTIRWTGLEIVAAVGGRLGESAGTVEFVARFREDGVTGSMHESSRFRRVEGNWRYLDGDQLS